MKSKYYLFCITLLTILIPTSLFAAEFRMLVGIPGLDNINDASGLNVYINALYRLSISLAALLAVVKIVAAGAKYMLTDIVPAKEEAKKDIQGALIGLLIVIGAIIILNTVNTDLAEIDFNLEGVVLSGPATTTPDTNQALCDSTGGCTYYSCGRLFDEIVSYARTACYVTGAIGAVGGGVAGSAVPVLGNITGFLSGGVFGCIGGALSVAATGYVLDTATCTAGCSLAGGTFVTGGQYDGQCQVPNNAELFSRVQLEQAATNLDQAREAEKEQIATTNPIPASGLGNYFEVADNYFSTLRAVTDETDIVIADRPIVAQRLGLGSVAELSDNLNRISQTAIYKNIPYDQLADVTSEYNVMLANAETQIRATCTTGTVEKMQVTESTQTSLTNVAVLTRYYCIR